MYRSSPLRSTLNTGYITGLDMCKVCTEAVHSVALWTRVTLQFWTCVKYVPKQSIAQRFEHVCKCKKNVIIPTPPHPMWCVRGWLGWKNVYLWLQSVCAGDSKMAVCARDSSLCARVTLAGKNDAKLCLCVLVTPAWPFWNTWKGCREA